MMYTIHPPFVFRCSCFSFLHSYWHNTEGTSYGVPNVVVDRKADAAIDDVIFVKVEKFSLGDIMQT